MPHLVCVSGKLSGKEFPVRDRMRIGRLDTCDMYVPHDDVSREHATLRHEGGRWIFQDLGSKNGTAINGAKKKSAELKSGDRLTLGDMVFCFIDESEPAPDESEPAPDESESAPDESGRQPAQDDSGEAPAAPSSGTEEAVDGDRPSDESGEAVAASAAGRRPAAAARGFAFEAGLDEGQRRTLENVLFGFVWLLVFFCASIGTQVLLRMIAV